MRVPRTTGSEEGNEGNKAHTGADHPEAEPSGEADGRGSHDRRSLPGGRSTVGIHTDAARCCGMEGYSDLTDRACTSPSLGTESAEVITV